MTWENIVKAIYTDLPEGLVVSKEGFKRGERGISEVEDMFDQVTQGQSFISSRQTGFGRVLGQELMDIQEAMDKLNIDISYAKLNDKKYNREEDYDGDGLYEYDVKSGIAVMVSRKGKGKTLYFVVSSEGAYTEEGDKPMYRVPRVLSDEEVFVDVVLEALDIGEGPSKDPARNDMDDDRESYQEWWNTLSRDDKEDAMQSGSPPPEEYGRGPWPPRKDW